MIKKDLIFYTIIILWLILGMIEVALTDFNGVSYTSMGFISVILILVFFKTINRKFANWLESNV